MAVILYREIMGVFCVPTMESTINGCLPGLAACGMIVVKVCHMVLHKCFFRKVECVLNKNKV